VAEEFRNLRQQLLDSWSGEEKTPEEQLRSLAQVLLIVPLIMIVLFGVGQLALLGSARIAPGETTSELSADYAPWSYLPIKAVGAGLLEELVQDADAEIHIGMAGLDPLDAYGTPWLEETTGVGTSGGTPEGTQTWFPGSEIPDATTAVPTTQRPPIVGGASATPTKTATPTPTPSSTPSFTPTKTATLSPPPPDSPTPSATPTTDIPGVDWWDPAYGYRQQISIQAGSASVPSGYTIGIGLNHSSLVSAGKAQFSGNDLRIVRKTSSGWDELDRVLGLEFDWGAPGMVINFPLQSSINANQLDDSYYLYYGNSSAGSPPANPQNVYWYFNDFSSASALSDWTQHDVSQSSSWSVSGGKLRQTGDAAQTDIDPQINSKLVLTGRPAIHELMLEVNVFPGDKDLTAFGLCSNDAQPDGFYVGFSSGQWFHDASGFSRIGYWLTPQDKAEAMIIYKEEIWYPLSISWTNTKTQASVLGFKYSWKAGPPGSGRFCFALNSMSDVRFDDLRIRKYSNPEPSVSLQSEESR